MRKKTQKVYDFIQDLHNSIVTNPQFRNNVARKTESAIQAEIRPIIIRYLEVFFGRLGYKDPIAKANSSFYWEGEESSYQRSKQSAFASKNYPDFIIQKPYMLALEYKKASSGSVVKHGIGQSIMHTLSGEFDFVYLLIHDENKDKRIKKSCNNKLEAEILRRMESDFNVFVKIV